MYKPNITKENYIFANRQAIKATYSSHLFAYISLIVSSLLLLGVTIWLIIMRVNVNTVVGQTFWAIIIEPVANRGVFEFPIYFLVFALIVMLITIALKNRVLRSYKYSLTNNKKLYPVFKLQYYVKLLYFLIAASVAPAFGYSLYISLNLGLFFFDPANIFVTTFILTQYVIIGLIGVVWPLVLLGIEYALVKRFDYVLLGQIIFNMRSRREFNIAKKTSAFKFQLARVLALFIKWDSQELMLSKKEKELVLSGVLDSA